MLTVMIVIFGGFALIVVLAAIVGMFLPEDYPGQEAHRSSRTPEQVWTQLCDVTNLTFGGKQCRRVRVLSSEGEPLRWEENLGHSNVTNEVIERDEGKRLVIEGKDSVIPMTLRREITLAPEPSGTLVTVQQNIHVENGTFHVPFFRLAMSMGAATAGIKDYLRRLANRLQERRNPL